MIAYCLGGFAELAMSHEEPERAAELLGASTRLFEEVAAAIDADEAETQEKVRAYATAALGEERFDELRTRGRGLGLEEASALAVAVAR